VLHPGRGDFDDIFERGLDFHRLPILRPYLSDAETLLRIAEVYLRKGYPDDARPIYEELLQRGEGDSEMLHQKFGYCLQSIGDVDGALREYDAMTDGDRLHNETPIRVVAVLNGHTVLVEKL